MFLWACQCGVRFNNSSCVLQENSRLEEEVSLLKEKLSEADSTISKIQKDLEHLLQDKVRCLYAVNLLKIISFFKNNNDNWSMLVLLNSMVALIQMAQDCWIKRSTSQRSLRSTSSNAGYELSCVCLWCVGGDFVWSERWGQPCHCALYLSVLSWPLC